MLTQRLLAVSEDELSFERRGWHCPDPNVRAKLETILRTFVAGSNFALAARDPDLVAHGLVHAFDAHHVGFAFEGAGMAYALLDLASPWTDSRLRAFTDGAGRDHDYLACMGAGLAIARVPWGTRLLNRYLDKLDDAPACRLFDGFGFHQGIFHPGELVGSLEAPPSFPDHGRQLFDSGVARSLWWSQGASPTRLGAAIDRVAEHRRAEMWCGIGVAASYAGGVEPPVLWDVFERSGAYAGDFLSGALLAARMRQKGGNPSAWTNLACLGLLKLSADQAADLVDLHVRRLAAELDHSDRAARQQGYGLLRERLIRAIAEHRPAPSPGYAA